MPVKQLYNIHDFSPATSIPDLSGRVIVVTGGNAGIGKHTVLELSRHNPQRLYLAARSRAKFDVAMKEILQSNPNARIDFLELDLSSIDSVKAAATTILDRESRLDILINNAGIMAVPAALSPAGYEIQFATNYFGHAALTKLLMPLMIETAKALPEAQRSSVRVVHVSSGAAYAPGLIPSVIDWNAQNTKREDLNSYSRYGITKLAQILYAKQCAEQWPEVMHVALHPGRVDTGILTVFMENSAWSAMGMFQRVFDFIAGPMPADKGAWTTLWAATWSESQSGKQNGASSRATAALESGGMYSPVGVKEQGSAKCRDEKLRKALWEWTEKELQRFGI